MEYLILLLAAFGITFTIVHAEIMDILKIRQFFNKWNFTKKLQKCSLCTGFYVSLLLAYFYLPISQLILFGFAGSGFAFFFERLSILIDEGVLFFEKDKKPME